LLDARPLEVTLTAPSRLGYTEQDPLRQAGNGPRAARTPRHRAPPTTRASRWRSSPETSGYRGASTTRTYAAALRKAGEQFGGRDPATITAPEVAEWAAGSAQDHKPGTVKLHVAALRLLFDFAGLTDANPARDPRVRLPKMTREEPQPPSAEHLEAILRVVDAKHLLALAVIEQGGMRGVRP